MEISRILNTMEKNYGFSYIINIQIDTKQIKMIVRNAKKVPTSMLNEMAKLRLQKHINEIYTTYKHYRSQTFENFQNKIIKQSNIEIEDLNDIEVYDLNLHFNERDEIINKSINENNKRHVEIKQSKINEIEFDV